MAWSDCFKFNYIINKYLHVEEQIHHETSACLHTCFATREYFTDVNSCTE
jgi:hypothetical protein